MRLYSKFLWCFILIFIATSILFVSIALYYDYQEQHVWPFVWFLLILLFVNTATIYALLLNLVVRPLKKIIREIDLVTKGDFSNEINLKMAVQDGVNLPFSTAVSRIKVDTSDEVGELAQNFYKMKQFVAHLLKNTHLIKMQIADFSNEMTEITKFQEIAVLKQESTAADLLTTAKEIFSVTKELALVMEGLNKASQETHVLMDAEKTGLEKISLIMQQLIERVAFIGGNLSILDKKTAFVESLMNTITNIAAQTNILSLNAAIQASKAGESGRSFAIIAHEIHSLSEQTTTATNDIKKTMYEITESLTSAMSSFNDHATIVYSTASELTQVSEQLSEIMNHIYRQKHSSEKVEKGMQNQAVATEKVKESLIALAAMLKQNTEAMQKIKLVLDIVD